MQTTKGRIVSNAVPLGESTVSRGGFRKTYSKGDKVLLYFGLGYPIIMGCIPRPQVSTQATPLTLADGTEPPATGSTLHAGAVKMDSTSPAGFSQGDQVMTSQGGAALGVLRGGSVLLRGGRNSELLLSKLRGLGRLFTSNWEHFSDTHSDVLKNLGGKLYRYTGYAKTYPETKIEDYKLHFYYANVDTAEAVKTAYQFPVPSGEPTPLLYKEQVTATGGDIKMHRTFNDSGEVEVWITNGTHFTRVTSTAETLTFAWNDETYITIDGTQIIAHHKDGSEVFINSSVIQANHKDGGQLVMDSGSIVATKGSGKLTITPSSSKLENSGHSVTVTGGGVSIA